MFERPAVPGRDADRKPRFSPKESTSTPLAAGLGSPVGRAVVHDEDVDVGQLAAQVAEHGRQVLLLVPGGHEDDGVAHAPRLRLRSARATRSCGLQEKREQLPNERRYGEDTGTRRNEVSIPAGPSP